MTLAGFGLAVAFGIALGLVLGASRFFYAGFYPLLVGFNSIPKVAVVPILVIWFGVGWLPAVLTAFMISFFPIVVNVATGLATIEPETEDVLKALGASKLQIMTKVGIPRSLPYFFGSLKVAITLAYVGSVIASTTPHAMASATSWPALPPTSTCRCSSPRSSPSRSSASPCTWPPSGSRTA